MVASSSRTSPNSSADLPSSHSGRAQPNTERRSWPGLPECPGNPFAITGYRYTIGREKIMATPAIGLRPCAIQVNLFTGARTPLPAGIEALLTLRDGNQNEVPLPNNGFFTVPTIDIGGLGFFDNFGDNYTVVASADGYSQAGFTPVTVNPRSPGIVDIMLLGKDATYSFRDARWDSLKLNYKEYASLLAAGADDAQAAQDC